ncbi:MAG TPA: MarR family transcriptional regulator [Caulobacteraceae bacterium]|jgi:DNA-binding MarR family transcriptional regulator|nr:MarR family transcriptional regulator [Caulobacteraceae bacterium]
MSDDPRLEALAVELSTAVGQFHRRVRAAAAGADELNVSQTAALVRLDRNGRMTTSDLARAESMKPQSMGAILATLEEEGLVERRPHPTDGRQVEFGLTPKGVEARRRRSAAKREWLMAALSKLSPGERNALASAIALIKRMGEA